MSKGIIVVDVPERCDDCPIRHMGLAWCNVAQKSTSHTAGGKPMNERKRPDWCPIQPMPKEKYEDEDEEYEADLYRAEGWNDCIREILEGSRNR